MCMMEEMNDSNYTLLNLINPHQKPIILYKWVTREKKKEMLVKSRYIEWGLGEPILTLSDTWGFWLNNSIQNTGLLKCLRQTK